MRARIADGAIPPDTPLTADLAAEFHIGTRTVSNALRPLVEEGLLKARRGFGTTLAPPATACAGPATPLQTEAVDRP
ncbi:GntR family transcriptional regulator [Streptomyces sp. NBC_00102]|uniref:GntR family transcriptional regulator n=1 Tax=Streptomyces sp. NBC_00102 TaxID=2975652 RepID=UPI00338EE2A0